MYIVYCGDRTWKHCKSYQEAEEYCINMNGGKIYSLVRTITKHDKAIENKIAHEQAD